MTEGLEAELELSPAGFLSLDLLLAGGGLLVLADFLAVVEVVDVPSLLGEDVQTAMPRAGLIRL